MKKLAILIACAIGSVAAHAEPADINAAITAYNTATTEGGAADRVEAARMLSEAVLDHPERDDAVLLAYEAGQTICVYADCADAAAIAGLARDLAANSETPSVAPAQINLLSAFAQWAKKDNRDSRQALNAALDAVESRDVTTLSLAAFNSRYVADIADRDWKSAQQHAAQAAGHFEPFKTIIGQQWSDARIVSITSGFNHTSDTGDAIAMAEHVVALAQLADALGATPDWLERHYYLSDAWQMAMTAYFHSGGGRKAGGKIRGPDPDKLQATVDEILRARDGISVSGSVSEEPDAPLPFCDGTLNQEPPLKYPAKAGRRGMYGAVILHFEINDLKVEGAEVLAAVPSAVFEEQAVATVNQWTWKVENGTPGVTCRTSRTNIILPMLFALAG